MKFISGLLKTFVFGSFAYYINTVNSEPLFSSRTLDSSHASDPSCHGYMAQEDIAYCAEFSLNPERLDELFNTSCSTNLSITDSSFFNNYKIGACKLRIGTGYKTLQISMSSVQQGVIVQDGIKVGVSFSDPEGTIGIYPCIHSVNPDCYMAIKSYSPYVDALDQHPHIAESGQRSRLRASNSDRQEAAADKPLPYSDEPFKRNVNLTVFYTPQTVSYIGANNLELRTKSMVEIIQQTLDNSDINILKINLQQIVIYDKPISTNFRNAFRQIKQEDKRGGHIAVLIAYLPGICGYTHIDCSRWDLYAVNQCTYFVLSQYCIDYSAAHEFGHIFGMAHNIEAHRNPYYSYGQGYVSVANEIRTCLSYPVGPPTQRIRYFSNPYVKTPEGYELGDANTDNRRVILYTAPILLDKIELANRIYTRAPTARPTNVPTICPTTQMPTQSQSFVPTTMPTKTPTTATPSQAPSNAPTTTPTTALPSVAPSTFECPYSLRIPPLFADSSSKLVADPLDSEHSNICFNINAQSGRFRGSAYLRLKLDVTVGAPTVHSIRLPTRNGRAELSFKSEYNASFIILGKRGRTKYLNYLISPTEFSGDVEITGDKVNNLDDIRCHSRCSQSRLVLGAALI